MDIKNLIKGCKKNERKAQSELFRRYKDTLYFVSLKYCRNKREAEDNLHDAFLTIFQSIKKYRSEGSFEGWMKRITIFKAIDKYKSKKEFPSNINEDILGETIITEEITKLALEDLLRLIQELPDQYRLTFNLHQMDGYKHREIAQLLSISENTSKTNYHRAKIILRNKIIDLTLNQKNNTNN